MTRTSDSPQRRRWTRFGLRLLLVAMCVSCLILGTWSVYVKPFRDQALAVKVVSELRGTMEAQGAAGPAWQRWLVTTAKDAVKLGAAPPRCYALEVELEVTAGRAVLDALLDALPQARAARERDALHEGTHG